MTRADQPSAAATNAAQHGEPDPITACLQIAARRGAALRLAGLLLDGAVAVERAHAARDVPQNSTRREVANA